MIEDWPVFIFFLVWFRYIAGVIWDAVQVFIKWGFVWFFLVSLEFHLIKLKCYTYHGTFSMNSTLSVGKVIIAGFRITSVSILKSTKYEMYCKRSTTTQAQLYFHFLYIFIYFFLFSSFYCNFSLALRKTRPWTCTLHRSGDKKGGIR